MRCCMDTVVCPSTTGMCPTTTMLMRPCPMRCGSSSRCWCRSQWT
jgi:hypothetical protein